MKIKNKLQLIARYFGIDEDRLKRECREFWRLHRKTEDYCSLSQVGYCFQLTRSEKGKEITAAGGSSVVNEKTLNFFSDACAWLSEKLDIEYPDSATLSASTAKFLRALDLDVLDVSAELSTEENEILSLLHDVSIAKRIILPDHLIVNNSELQDRYKFRRRNFSIYRQRGLHFHEREVVREFVTIDISDVPKAYYRDHRKTHAEGICFISENDITVLVFSETSSKRSLGSVYFKIFLDRLGVDEFAGLIVRSTIEGEIHTYRCIAKEDVNDDLEDIAMPIDDPRQQRYRYVLDNDIIEENEPKSSFLQSVSDTRRRLNLGIGET